MSENGERRTPGKGLINGLAVTLKMLVKPTITQQYPDVQPDLPPRSRGVIALLEENCTVCMLCARECPDWCIYIDAHKETFTAVAVDEVGRRVAERTFKSTSDGCYELVRWASRWPERRFAVEDCRHLTRRLESDLLIAGETLVRVARRVLRRAGAVGWYRHKVHTFSHGVGTARMGTDPAASVLDPDCRFRGLENLTITDASVFPTSAGVNPSLTITALSEYAMDQIPLKEGYAGKNLEMLMREQSTQHVSG